MSFIDSNPTDIEKTNYDGAVQEIKNAYDKNVKLATSESNDETYFAWKNKNMIIHNCIVSTRLGSAANLIFATPSDTDDKLAIYNFKKETKNFDFFNFFREIDQISYLFSKHLLPEGIRESIILPSINIYKSSWSMFAADWVNNEYKTASKHFSMAPIELLNFNSIGLHAAKYKFETMIDTINDPQFTVELSECLNAYEHEKYYVAAAGLGGIIESLLYFTLDNYGMTGKGFPNDPTLSDFLSALKNANLIDRRRIASIKSTFLLRNSISHYNSGFTSVDQCQSLMHGMTNIFNEYYLKSQSWHSENPGLSYPESLKRQ